VAHARPIAATRRATYPEGIFLPRSRGLPVFRLPPGTAIPQRDHAVERNGMPTPIRDAETADDVPLYRECRRAEM
jgi:hypothetical protein